MARIKTWEISDEFWQLVEPSIPTTCRDAGKTYIRKPGGGRKRSYSDRLYFAAIVLRASYRNYLECLAQRKIRRGLFCDGSP